MMIHFQYSAICDLVYHILAHMKVENASDLYSEDYINLISKSKNETESLLCKEVEKITEYYNDNFERLGIINFLPCYCSALEELQNALLTYNDFTDEDKDGLIEIRKNLNAETWDDLLDIVNLRNMIVHNNGQVDKRFESTSTFRRWKDRVDIPLIKIEDEDIAKLLSSVIDAVTIISNLYLKEYYQRRNRVIANYYFNKENAYDFFADTE